VGRSPRVVASLQPWANLFRPLTHSRLLARPSRAFGFTEFLSPLPKRLKSGLRLASREFVKFVSKYTLKTSFTQSLGTDNLDQIRDFTP